MPPSDLARPDAAVGFRLGYRRQRPRSGSDVGLEPADVDTADDATALVIVTVPHPAALTLQEQLIRHRDDVPPAQVVDRQSGVRVGGQDEAQLDSLASGTERIGPRR